MRKLMIIVGLSFTVNAIAQAANLTAYWASDGGNRVSRQDFYPHSFSTFTITRNWDGTTAKTFGARNETVSLVLYMKAGASDATSVNVVVSSLTGPSGSGIESVAVSSTNVFDWTTRPIEVFYVRYIPLRGLSQLGFESSEYETRHYPRDFRVPCTVNVNDDCVPDGGTQLWTNRFGHEKFYPDILVPMEVVAASSFTVSASSSQAIWIDYYIAAGLTPGTYTGSIAVREGVVVSTTIPVQLIVYNVTLPDVPTMKNMSVISQGNINFRHHGTRSPANELTEPYYTTKKRYMQMAHRHKLNPIGDDQLTADTPRTIDVARLDGTLYATTTGYGNAPGISTGDRVYSIGTYGSWQAGWSGATTSATTLCSHISAWQTYMNANYPSVRSFLYLTDEPTVFVDTHKWSTWMSTAPACQNASYKTWPFVTAQWTTILTTAPYVGMPASTSWMGVSSTTWETAADYYLTTASTQGWAYNGYSPWTAALFNHEEEGWGPREIAWGAFKKGASRIGAAIPWFLWETTYFNDSNNESNENDVWNDAQTFGYDTYPSTSASKGRTGYQYNNGDGVYMYPGTDLSYLSNSYGIDGPLASWRMKMFRRGVQDADIMAQAYAINPTATMAIVNALTTTVMWEKNCFLLADCTYTYGERGFTQEAGAYEDAKEDLLDIIVAAIPPESVLGTVQIRGTVEIRGTVTIR